jgi:Spy/CpxP family protein refolding chaperone|tara:strand:- start:4218 stop:4769 length:552 start_codon:yes stop_codon:yes gene_type:complete
MPEFRQSIADHILVIIVQEGCGIGFAKARQIEFVSERRSTPNGKGHKMGIRNTMTALAASVIFAASAGGAVLAQDAAPATPEQPPMAAPATDFDQSQIESFAVAYVQIMDIGMQAEQQLQSAETDDDRAVIQMMAQEQMASTVESTDGISVDEYNAILTAAQADPVFAEEVGGAIEAIVQPAN